MKRLGYLDWMRGVAAVTMLNGHVFHSFLRTDLRPGGPYQITQFVGGMPPAVFLFLLGVTFAFLMDSQERKGVGAGNRFLAALKRSGYLFAAAFAFRFQLWLFAQPVSSWLDLFRVDILNSMGLALFVFAVMAVFRTVERVRLCAILGFAVAVVTPVVGGLDWSWASPIVRNYLLPDRDFFGFFPWAAFVAFGMSAGSLLRTLKEDEVTPAMQWIGWGGVALAFSAYTLSFVPFTFYPNYDFWLNSPSLTFIKVGAVLMMLAFAYVWTPQSWSWVRQIGVTSLLVYWVHVELVYGRWLGYFKERLTLGQTVLGTAMLLVAMLGISLLRTNWQTISERLRAGRETARRQPSRTAP